MTIIALVDGSTYAHSVCELAGWAALRSGAAIEVLHVLGRRESVENADLSGSIRLGARTALLEELAELDAQRAKLVAQRGRAILDDAKKVLTGAGVAEVSVRLRHGDLLEAFAEQDRAAQMVVIGKRGEAADFAKGHLGSNMERIVRATKHPVMVAARAFRPIKKLLIAFDGGPSAQRAVQHVAQSAVYKGLAVSLVTVGTVTTALTNALEDAQAKLKGHGYAADIQVLAGQPEAVLGKLIEDAGYDLLIMGAYGHSRIRSLIIGSTTTEMIRSCKVPVVLIR
jgi:nucleotide-binding universal stress UspA family protein